MRAGDEVGLSWFGRDTPNGRIIVDSSALRITLVPEQSFASFVLTNADLGAQLHAEITKRALGDFLGIADLDAKPLALPPADPASYVGTYRFTNPETKTSRSGQPATA